MSWMGNIFNSLWRKNSENNNSVQTTQFGSAVHNDSIGEVQHQAANLSLSAKNLVYSENVGTSNNYFNVYPDANSTKSKFPVQFGIFDHVPSFRGREKEIEKLVELFQENNVVAICGMGGIGKTELARYFISHNIDKYSSNALWIKGETDGNLSKSFRGVAKDLSIPNCEKRDIRSVVQEVYSYFHGSSVLFVIDNAQNISSIETFLPTASLYQSARINILITTQYTEWDDIPALTLEHLSLEAALQVFASLVGAEYFAKIAEDEWKELAEIFYCVPLGLQIGASYVKQRLAINLRFSISGYIERLREDDIFFNKKLSYRYEKSIYMSLLVTLENLGENDSDEAKRALVTVNVCAYLDADNITNEILLKLPIINGSTDSLEEALSVLKQYSLILDTETRKRVIDSRFDYSIIRIHRLVQKFLRYHHEKDQTVMLNYYGETFNLVTSDADNYINLKLHCACILKFTTYLRKLFESLTSSEVKSIIENRCLLHMASQAYLYNTISLLLECGADANNVNYSWYLRGTPLFYLTVNGYYLNMRQTETLENCVRLLLQHMEDIREEDFNNRNILHFSSRWRCPALVESILNRNTLSVNARDVHGRTSVHYVSFEKIYGDTEMDRAKQCFRSLIARNAALDYIDDWGQTALHYSAKYTNWPLVEFLIDECNADVNVLDHIGNTPLLLVPEGKLDDLEEIDRAKMTIKSLEHRQAQIDIQNSHGENILHLVAERQCFQLIEHLSDNYNLDVCAIDTSGCMPLHHLSFKYVGEEKIARTRQSICSLLQRGVNINSVDSSGRSILSYAGIAHNWLLVEHLIDCYKMDPNKQDNDGRCTLLLVAAQEIIKAKDLEHAIATVKSLISRKAQLSSRSKEGRTMLHEAALTKSPEFLEFLLEECHFDPNDRDSEGKTALDHIPFYFGTRKRAMVEKCTEILLKWGACTTETNKSDEQFNSDTSNFALIVLP